MRDPKGMRGRRTAVASLLSLTALLAACGGGGSTPTASGGGAEADHVRVAYLPITTALPAWVAKERGFFDDNRLDVELTSTPNINTLPSLMGKQFDFALSTQPDLIKAVSNGVDVVEVAGDALDTKENPTVLIMVRPDSGIRSIADLKGKRLAAPSLGGNIHLSLLNLLQQNGVAPASIQAVQVSSPNIPDQIKAGQVDAGEVLQPFAKNLLAQGFVSLGDPFRSVGESVVQTFWISERGYAQEHRDVVARWTAALEQASAYIREHEAEARQILQKYAQQPMEVAATTPLPTYDFAIDAEELGVWVDVLRQVGGFSAEVDPSTLVLSP